MRDLTEAPAPYLATVVNEYRQKLASTSVAMGQAILWLTVVTDGRQDRDGGPLADIRHQLEEAQTTLNLTRSQLTDVLQLLDRENQENQS